MNHVKSSSNAERSFVFNTLYNYLSLCQIFLPMNIIRLDDQYNDVSKEHSQLGCTGTIVQFQLLPSRGFVRLCVLEVGEVTKSVLSNRIICWLNDYCGRLAEKARYWKVEDCLKTSFFVAQRRGICNFWQSEVGNL